MKLQIPLSLLFLILLQAISAAEDGVTFTTRDGVTYKNVTISKVEPSGLQVMTDDGVERIPFARLPEAMQKEYLYDPTAAANYDAGVANVQAKMAADARAQETKWKTEGQPVATPTAADRAKDRKLKAAANRSEKSDWQNDAGLPWPVEGHAFTLTELNRYRKTIDGQIVWVRLTSVGDIPEKAGDEYKVFVSDGKSSGESADNYSFVYFPAEGAKKMNLLGKTSRGALSFYVRVSPNRLTAVARSKEIDSFHNTFAYTW